MAKPVNPDEPTVRQWPITLTGIVVLILCSIIYVNEPPFLNTIVLQSHDRLIKLNAEEPQSGRVVFVDLDDASLQRVGQWPWERVRVARMVDNLREAGVRVVTFDVAFSEHDRLSPSVASRIWREVVPDFEALPEATDEWPDFDALFAEAVAKVPTVLGFYVYMVDDPVKLDDAGHFPVWRGNFIERGRQPEGNERAWLAQGANLKPPITVLRERASMGFINAVPDKDNILRRSPLLIAIGDKLLYPSLGLESVCLAMGTSNVRVYYDDAGQLGVKQVAIQDVVIPTDANGRLVVNYRRGTFPTLQAADVLSGDFDPEDVRDRIAMIGSSAVGLYDRYTTPLGDEISGALIQATIIDNILAGDMLSEPRWMFFVSLAGLLVGGIVLTLLVIRTRAFLSLIVFLFILGIPFVVSIVLLKHRQLVFIPTPLMMGWALTYAGIIVMKYWQQEILAAYDAKLRVVNRQLEDEVVVRTAAEKEALAARTAALQAAAAKSEFLANMSHEIRTPMNSIIGMSDLALRTDLTGQQFNYIAKVRYSANALLRLINDILDFSKLEAGKLDVENVAFDLDAVLSDIVDLLGHKVAEKKIDLILDCAPGVPRAVIGDPLRLRQVLINLAANAIKFTEQGHVCLRVTPVDREGSVTDDRVAMLFEVLDTGIGLTEPQRASLFQAFQQADASTTRKYGGTGLGLAISKNLVELMGGQIAVSSVYGEGSNFHFNLPFGRQSADNEPLLELPAEARGRHVLVVGRTACLMDVVARDCRTLGLRIEMLDDPSGLAQRLESMSPDDPFDLLIADAPGFETPDPVGYLAAFIAQDGGVLPSVLLQVPDPNQEPGAKVISGPVRVVDKPVKTAELISAIRTALGYDPLPQSAMWQAVEAPKIEKDRLKHARVLLVDDNPINREVATENMIIYGIKVECAVNGREAIEKASAQPWNLILMDVQMPEVDGYEATREIRRLEQAGQTPRPRTAIVAMTANAMQEDEDRCRECGMDDYLSKPLETDVFLRKLLHYIPSAEIPLDGAPAAEDEPDAGPAIDPHSLVETASTPAAAAPQTGIPPIPGADVEAGLRRLQGNVSLYRRLLVDFATSHAHDHEAIMEAVNGGDDEAARKIAHAIKGSAANLGLTEIQRLSTVIDQLFREDNKDAAVRQVGLLEQELIAFVKAVGIEPVAESRDAADATAETVALPPEVRAQAAKLIEALRQGDVEALDALADVVAAMRDAGVGGNVLDAIMQAGETYDFEKAAGLVAGYLDEGEENDER